MPIEGGADRRGKYGRTGGGVERGGAGEVRGGHLHPRPGRLHRFLSVCGGREDDEALRRWTPLEQEQKCTLLVIGGSNNTFTSCQVCDWEEVAGCRLQPRQGGQKCQEV